MSIYIAHRRKNASNALITPSLYNCITLYSIPRIARLISSANRDFSANRDILILRLINTLAYLFTDDFVADNIYGSFVTLLLIVL